MSDSIKTAIYSRKSKFTGKGDSIENQIQLCKEYGKSHFQLTEDDFIIYEDEGFSGGNIDRPQFQLLLKDMATKKVNMLICYRLDRISRNVADFSSTLELLEKHNVSFVSIRENFDTSTPMGKAMIYIASVFAQLERETIAERIRDNMLQLAKTGRWLGGNTPSGYKSEQVVTTTIEGKSHKLFKLVPIPCELERIKLLFNKYLELKSITKLESYCVQNKLETKHGKEYTRYSLRFILGNPVYIIADQDTYDFLKTNNYDLYCEKDEFNGEFGLMVYNKTNQIKSSRFRDASEWIVAVGAHQGIISGKDWVKIQNLLIQNKSKSYRKVKNSTCLLSGLIRCGSCGSFMRPKIHNKPNKQGIVTFSYMCEMKEKSKKTRCTIDNAPGNLLDELVIEQIKQYAKAESNFDDAIEKDKIFIQTQQDTLFVEISALESKIKSNAEAINNLVSSLSEGKNSSASKYIITQIEFFDKQNAEAKEKLFQLKQIEEQNLSEEKNLDFMKGTLASFAVTIDSLNVEAKRAFLRSIIEKIKWDGESIEINLFGEQSRKKD